MGSDRYLEEHQFIGTGGIGHLSSGGSGTTPVPKRKTLEFANLTFTYDYETRLFGVEASGKTITFDESELAELRTAMTTFGLPVTSTSGMVNYRS